MGDEEKSPGGGGSGDGGGGGGGGGGGSSRGGSRRSRREASPEDCGGPTGWSAAEKESALVSISRDHLRVHVKGQSERLRDGITVRATEPIPSSVGLFYFEVKVVSKGRGGGGSLAVGLSSQLASLLHLPGADVCSVGYHGVDGCKHSSIASTASPAQLQHLQPAAAPTVTRELYGPAFTTGDTVGCGLNLLDNTCFFTKNGRHLGVAFSDLPADWSLYPAVGLQSLGTIVDANFGQHPFVFDIDQMKKELGLEMRQAIYQMTLPDTTDSNAKCGFDTGKVVMSYLLHNGYTTTASALASARGQNVAEDIELVERRQTIHQLIMEGQMTKAIELTDLHYPCLLIERPKLQLLLRVRQFVELVSGADTNYTTCSRRSVIISEAMDTDQQSPDALDLEEVHAGRLDRLERILDCGRKLHHWHSRVVDKKIRDRYRDVVRDAFSLLAYSDPTSSPIGWQFDACHREIVANQLRNAIFKKMNTNKRPVLESAVNYAKELLNLMRTSGMAEAAFVKYEDVVN